MPHTPPPKSSKRYIDDIIVHTREVYEEAAAEIRDRLSDQCVVLNHLSHEINRAARGGVFAAEPPPLTISEAPGAATWLIAAYNSIDSVSTL